MSELDFKNWLIYESPDGGKTIYARKLGESQRTLYYQDPEYAASLAKSSDDSMWLEIRKMSDKNPSLKKILEQAILVYRLSIKDAQ